MSGKRKKYPTEWTEHGTPQLEPGDWWITQATRGGEVTVGLYERGTESRDTGYHMGELREARRVGVTLHEFEVRHEIATLMEIAAAALKKIRLVAEAKWNEQRAGKRGKGTT